MKNLRFALSLAAVLALAGAGAALADGPAIGAAAPNFTLTTIDGKSFSLAEAQKSHKAVVVMFIASTFPLRGEARRLTIDSMGSSAQSGRVAPAS